MKFRSFRRGGVHPPDNKLGAGERIEVLAAEGQIMIPLSQHIGAPATATVVKGDRVLVGQVIGRATGFVSANVHSSVSGSVVALGDMPDSTGVNRPMVTIEVEGDEWEQTIDRDDRVVKECNLNKTEIIAKIKEAGVVGMGGAMFPTHVKLTVPKDKTAEYLIVNGVECEPYLTSDHRLMLERGEEVLVGAQIMAKALGANRIVVGIEKNKRDAIAHLSKLSAADKNITIVGLKTKYPQGCEKQMIEAILGRAVPSGALPIDVGVVVQNVSTSLAVYEAVQKNKPLIERVVTVAGSGAKRVANVRVRIGMPIRKIIEHCGASEDTEKVINGGPMMGRALSNLDSPLTKGGSGVLLMEGKEAHRDAEQVCIKCARCVDACPMGLEPYMLSKLSQLSKYEDLEGYYAADCIECGSCSYTCPASLALLDYIKIGKGELMKILHDRKK